MPDVHEFELFHGVVLTKLVRGERPFTLRLIETKVGELWAAYKVNDATIHIKHSVTPRRRTRGEPATVWQFTLPASEVSKICAPSGDWSEKFLVLVCGAKDVRFNAMQVCLLDSGQLAQLLDSGANRQQTISVVHTRNKSLRARSPRAEIIVPRNRLDKWVVPGG
jgi:hypothetical protein